jgi:hypothetical protein
MYDVNIIFSPTIATLGDFAIYVPPAFGKFTVKTSSSVTLLDLQARVAVLCDISRCSKET